MSNHPFPQQSHLMPPPVQATPSFPQHQQDVRTSFESRMAAQVDSSAPFGAEFNIDSFQTLSRGSLQVPTYNHFNEVPQQHISSGNEEKPIHQLPTPRSEVFFEEEDLEREAMRLLGQTDRLCLNSTGREENLPSQNDGLHSRRQSGRWVKDARRLVQELRREYKYSERIVADMELEAEGRRQTINGGRVQPILAGGDRLEGLLVEDGAKELKIQVKNVGEKHFEPVLEWWVGEEGWSKCRFKARIHNI